MIFTERKITISNNASSIDKQIVLYRGDKNVEIRFTISEFPFKYSRNNETNVIESTEASFGQLVIRVPNDKAPIFSDIVPTKKGSVIFTITGEMIDEISELGTYDFQIRLFDEEQNSRATIPPIEKGIEIREPIATEDVSDTNEVGVAVVNYAVTTTATASDVFDENGNYIKTTWFGGDVITSGKLNKIEAGIDGVNRKVAIGSTGGTGLTTEQAQQLSAAYQHSQTAHVQTSDIPTKTSDLTNDSNFVNETYVTNAINNAQLSGGGSILNFRDAEQGEIFTLCTSDENYGNIQLSTYRLTVTEGENTSFTVALDTAPTNNQTVSITVDNADVNVDPTSLTFTPDNYNVAQTVTVQTIADADNAVDYCNIELNTTTSNAIVILTINEPASSGGSESGFVTVTDGLVHAYDYKNIEGTTIEDLVGTDNLSINTIMFSTATDYNNGYVQYTGSAANGSLFKTSFQSPLSSYTILMRVSPVSVDAPTTIMNSSHSETAGFAQLVDWEDGSLGMYSSGTSARTGDVLSYGETPCVIGFMVDSATLTESVIYNGLVKASATGDTVYNCTVAQPYGYLPFRNHYKYYECVVYNRVLTTEELETVSNDLLAKGGTE